MSERKVSRRHNESQGKHTPQCPHKERARLWWLVDNRPINPSKDIVTISHGIFLLLDMLKWDGRILAADIDLAVQNAINIARSKNPWRGSCDYPNLNILPAGSGICSSIIDYNRQYGMSQLGAVDIDLAYCIKEAWITVAQHVINLLLMYGYHGKTILTYRNGRDCFGSNDDRIDWLHNQLPKCVKYVDHHTYNSAWFDHKARHQSGSPMCVVELKT